MYKNLSFGERVKLAMNKRDISPTQLAALIGVAASTIGSIIDTKRKTKSSSHAAAIAKHLNVSLEWLLSGNGDPFNGSSLVRSNSAVYNLNPSSRYIPISGTVNIVNPETQKFNIEDIHVTHNIKIVSFESNYKAVRINTSELQPRLKLGWVVVYDEASVANQGDDVIILFKDNQYAFAEYLYQREEWFEFDSLNNKGRVSINSNEILKIYQIAFLAMPNKVQAIVPNEEIK